MKNTLKIRNTIKSTREIKKYDKKHTRKCEIRVKAHVEIEDTIKNTRENIK